MADGVHEICCCLRPDLFGSRPRATAQVSGVRACVHETRDADADAATLTLPLPHCRALDVGCEREIEVRVTFFSGTRATATVIFMSKK